jgi:nitrogen regulatory protein P-II 1
LEGAGAPGITISRVHGVGYGYEPFLFTLAPSRLHKAPEVAKVEVVCGDQEAQVLIDALVSAARTGDPGDGIVFVTPVTHAVKIRTGTAGARALRKQGGRS